MTQLKLISTALRRYCFRVGLAFRIEDDEKCGECGRRGENHPIVTQNICANYAGANQECVLAIGHDGKCMSANDITKAVEYVMES